MRRSAPRLVLRSLTAGVALAALGLAVASPASAHTTNIYTFGYTEDSANFATVDRTTAVTAPLATNIEAAIDDVGGVEVFNEVGTAIGYDYDEPTVSSVLAWDHTTGAVTSKEPLFIADPDEVTTADVDFVFTLDTRNDGTIITFVFYTRTIENAVESVGAIATVNSTTGELTPVIDISPLVLSAEGYNVQSLATDPTTGETYLFLYRIATATTSFVPLNFTTPGYGTVLEFGGTGFESGRVEGTDFDADGTLYFIYSDNVSAEYELSTLGAPGTWAGAARTVVAPFDFSTFGVAADNLTIEFAPEPALADTGAPLPVVWLVFGAVAVLAGAVTVVTTTRRRTA